VILIFLTSGLFLGWSLGANDASNVFGTAVGSRMVSFKKAAIIAGLFVILGAVIQGDGATHTLGTLGTVSALAGSFTVALSAAITIFLMTKWQIPVSTSQAVVGAIIGWNLYSGNSTDYHSLTKIVSTWVVCPFLSALFAIVLYFIMKTWANRSKMHLLKFDSFLRRSLIVVGAFGAYSLGANNIANVMGVFVTSINLQTLDLKFFVLNSNQQLFLLGGIAIAVGIFTYSKKLMLTVGNKLFNLTPEAALVVVLAQSLVLFVFSSQTLNNLLNAIGLPSIPLVPVSSSQAIVGAILGIGILKGGRGIKFGILAEIAAGWAATPVMACIISFFALFFMNNVFKQTVHIEKEKTQSEVIEKIIEPNQVSQPACACFRNEWQNLKSEK